MCVDIGTSIYLNSNGGVTWTTKAYGTTSYNVLNVVTDGTNFFSSILNQTANALCIVASSNSGYGTWTYDYERDCIPLVETDPMPFIRDIETFKFCELASIRFNRLYTNQPKDPSASVEKDPEYISARATLLKLIMPTKPPKKYGKSFK